MEDFSIDDLLTKWKKIASRYNITWRNSFLNWDLPANVSADFSLNLALPIAYKINENPRKIAQKLVELSDCLNLESSITDKGYINFRFPTSYYQKFLTKTIQEKGENLKRRKKNICVNIEYVSANPTGYLNLAHLRNAFIGNVLTNVYKFCGYKVVKEYYINDRGGQVASLINSIYHIYHRLHNVILDSEKLDYISESNQEIAQKLVSKWEKKYINKILDEKNFNIWRKEILKTILTKIRQDLEKCGVKFNVWFSESNLYKKNNHKKLLKLLKEKSLIYHQNDATFFNSKLEGDDKDRVIIKGDGDYTYFFSDILYHLNKLQRANKIINIWGADHHGAISRLKSACHLLGYKKENIEIVLVQTVNLLKKEGDIEKFSKRKGNTIELEKALKYIDLDQLKFFLLEKETNQSILINTDLLIKHQKKTQLYKLQYAYARCRQIFDKARKQKKKIDYNIELLKEKNERKLFNLLIRFTFILENIMEENKPHCLIHYLLELTKNWHIYYQDKNNTIINKEKHELTTQKLFLIKGIEIVLKTGFNLLGITCPKKMSKN